MVSEPLFGFAHYNRCILSKRKLIQYYERKGNDGAVMVLENEIFRLQEKIKMITGGKTK